MSETVIEKIQNLPVNSRTDSHLYTFTGGEVSDQIKVSDLKQLATDHTSLQAMLTDAIYIEFENHALYSKDGKWQIFEKGKTSNSFLPELYDTALEAYANPAPKDAAGRPELIEAAKEYEALYHADPHDNRFYPEMMVDFHLSQTNHGNTSDDSPRSLLNEVVAKVVDAVGAADYALALEIQLGELDFDVLGGDAGSKPVRPEAVE